MNFIFFILLGILAGAFFPVQATINARLGQAAKNPVVASFVAFSVGSIVLFLLLLLFNFNSVTGLRFEGNSYLLFAGPITGVIFNLFNIIF